MKEIEKSEQNITNVMKVLEEEYLNPFGVQIDMENLYNLSSGTGKEDGVEELLCIWQNGKTIADEFMAERIHSNVKSFYDPISRSKIPAFHSPKVKLTTPRGTNVIDANRKIIDRLLSLTVKTQRPIDFEKALTCPLYGVPLSLAYPDGSRRETQKSKLLNIIAPTIQPHVNIEIDCDEFVYVVDMMAQIRVCSTNVPETFKDFILKFLQSIPRGYQRVDVVADTYRDTSIKNQERAKRGSSSKILIGSVSSKMPRDLNKFLVYNENKTELISLILNYIISNKGEMLETLQTQKMVLSSDNESLNVTPSLVSQSNLQSNQEEADTKVVLHALQILNETDLSVMLRSPSGDTDIFVILVGLVNENSHKKRVYYDYGNETSRKGTWLNDIVIEERYRETLLGFHAFTGNDYVSAFFRKGRKLCWNSMIRDEAFINVFSKIGENWNLSNVIKETLEMYVCNLYGSKRTSIDQARLELFQKKYTKQNKVIDALPLCRSSLLCI